MALSDKVGRCGTLCMFLVATVVVVGLTLVGYSGQLFGSGQANLRATLDASLLTFEKRVAKSFDQRLKSVQDDIIVAIGATTKDHHVSQVQSPDKDHHAMVLSSRLVSANELTVLVDRSGQQRVFNIAQCPGQERVTLPDLYPVFVAHQVEWTILGQQNAWHSVLTNPEFLTVTEEMKHQFFATGEEHINLLLRAMRAQTFEDEMAVYASREPLLEDFPIAIVSSSVKSPLKMKPHSSESPFGKVLDFGCGLARLGMAFAKSGSDVTCVDQSIHHLRMAEAEWNIRKATSKQKIHFVTSSPDLLSAVRGERFDFVHSVIVLQHMVPQLQAVYLQQFCDILRVGGQGWVQIPLEAPYLPCDLEKSMEQGGMQMHFTPADVIRDHISARGCDVQVLGLSRRYMGQGKSGLALFRKIK